MATSSTVSMVAVNLFVAGLYYVGRMKKVPTVDLHKRVFGIALASSLHCIRPYTDKHIQDWVSKRFIDYLYGATSLLIMGSANRWGHLAKKVNAFESILFTGIQVGTFKATQHFFREENPRLLDETFRNTNYLRSELFPLEDRAIERGTTAAHLYVLPEGFFIFLTDNAGLPFFRGRMGSVDSSEVCRLQEEYVARIDLSAEAIAKLRELSRQVTYDGNAVEWELDGIPPFICFEGTWNAHLNPYGTPVDWSSLITNGATHHHQTFQIRPLPATWTSIEQTPGLRGLSYNHTQIRFNIWVHEKNANVLTSARDSIQAEIDQLRRLVEFINTFESASLAFRSTGALPVGRRGNTDFNTLNSWGALTAQLPFPHLREHYPDLSQKIRAY